MCPNISVIRGHRTENITKEAASSSEVEGRRIQNSARTGATKKALTTRITAVTGRMLAGAERSDASSSSMHPPPHSKKPQINREFWRIEV